jgi:hydroxyacylglutathione hydrolase
MVTEVPPTRVAPGVERVTAPNASAWTAQGTNTYLLDGAEVLLVDPGPDDERHLGAILSALGGRRVGAILATHSHVDHSGLAGHLRAATGAPVLAWGDSFAGLRPIEGDVGGGTGIDLGFAPDGLVSDGERLAPWGVWVVHTPGHMGNHVCLDRGDVLLSGDQAMGWATSVVSPPDGDMGDYVTSLERLIGLGPRVLLPGHGEAVRDGLSRLHRLLAHRREREAEVLAALTRGPASAGEIAARVYAGLPDTLLRAAARNVLAHLVDLDRRGVAEGPRPLKADAAFRLREASNTPLGTPLDTPGVAR